MADTLPVPARSGVAREPLSPTDVVPGPRPVDLSGRDGHHVIAGEVLKPGRHRAPRAHRRIAVSGALLSAAGAFVTLALMTGHQATGTAAGARVSSGNPVPDLPDETAAVRQPAHPGESAAPSPAAAPGAVRGSVTRTVAAPRTAAPAAGHRESAADRMRAAFASDSARWAAATRRAAAAQDEQARHAAAGRQEARPAAAAAAGERPARGGRHRRYGRYR